MCDFCKEGKTRKFTFGYGRICVKRMNDITSICIEDEDDRYVGAFAINYCPFCGREMRSVFPYPNTKTTKSDGDYAFPFDMTGYMNMQCLTDFKCSNCGKQHERVLFDTEIVCSCGKKIIALPCEEQMGGSDSV